jgi:predicted esterase
LKANGAKVEMQWQAGGHEVTQNDVQVAKNWLSENFQAFCNQLSINN